MLYLPMIYLCTQKVKNNTTVIRIYDVASMLHTKSIYKFIFLYVSKKHVDNEYKRIFHLQ